jgi:surface polysaccharide O-acyltransferase-like enzyme
MDKAVSERISIIRFPLILGVMFVHSYTTTVNLSQGVTGVMKSGVLSTVVREYISQILGGISVPLFFLLSGFLFFYGLNFSLQNYLIKVKSRVHTLLIPFLIWNVLWFLLLIILQLIPFSRGFLSGQSDSMLGYTAFQFISAILGINRSPIAYHFWFIRDLILLILLAPVVKFSFEKASFLIVILPAVLWLADVKNYSPRPVAILFFCLGAFIAQKKYSLFVLDKHGKLILFLFLLFSIVDIIPDKQYFEIIIHKVTLTLGVFSALYTTRYFVQSDNWFRRLLNKLSPSSFFVFSMHEPVLISLRKISYRCFDPNSDFQILALYLLTPFVVSIICLKTFDFLGENYPSLASVLTGKRL